jgi:ATP-binding cassette subfamily C protein LapB
MAEARASELGPAPIEPTLAFDEAGRPPYAPEQDALLQALVWLTAHHGRERSALNLLDGQMPAAPLDAARAVGLLRNAGFEAEAVRRSPAELNALLFPAVLVLKNDDAAIITRRLPAEAGQPLRYELVMPAAGMQKMVAREDELLAESTGVLLLAAPLAESRQAEGDTPALRDHWLWGTIRQLSPYYRAAMLAALLSNVLMLATGMFTSIVFDKVIPHNALATLWAVALGALLAVAFDLAARQLRNQLIDTAGKKADLALGAKLFRQTLALRMEHRPASAGTFAHQLAQIESVRDFCASASLSALSDLPFVLLFIGMTFFVAGPVAWVLVIAAPLVIGMALVAQALLKRSTSAQMREQADLHGLLVEAVEGLEDLKAAGAQGQFLRRYERNMVAAAVNALQARALSSWINNIAMIMQQLVTVLMIVWGVYLIKDGALTSGALMASVMFGSRAIAPLGSVVALASRWQGARAAMMALNRVMSLPVEHASSAPLATPKLSGQVRLADVGFAYPDAAGNAGHPVLKGVNLAIQPGERVAVLGRIGSGKSTVLRLIGGLYQPREGRVEVDGIDLRQLDALDYRAQIGFVSQEPRLFNATLRDNVLLGRVLADAGKLAEVARLTGLDRVAAGHPQGFAMPVGESGCLLSGGQRQLVALARALVTKPRILLLDEPTSSMDAQSEMLFVKQLKAATPGVTLVAVTHRPAVLDLVDRVVVVEGGRIVMDGPKAKVLAALAGVGAGGPGAARPGEPPAQPGHPIQKPAAPAAPAAPPAATATPPPDGPVLSERAAA